MESYLCMPVEGKCHDVFSCSHITIHLIFYKTSQQFIIYNFMCLYSVYGLFGKSIFIVHQRSPCFPERISRYCEEFVDILTKIQCGKLIILTGAATDDIEVMNK